jgi:hypothetical protein
MKRSLLFLATPLLLFSCAFAQEKLTLYYDASGKGLDTKKKAVFYRVVTLDASGKPAGTVEDFYPNDKGWGMRNFSSQRHHRSTEDLF